MDPNSVCNCLMVFDDGIRLAIVGDYSSKNHGAIQQAAQRIGTCTQGVGKFDGVLIVGT